MMKFEIIFYAGQMWNKNIQQCQTIKNLFRRNISKFEMKKSDLATKVGVKISRSTVKGEVVKCKAWR